MFVFTMTAESFPESARIWMRLGETHEKLEDSENAAMAYEKAIQLDSSGETGREAARRLAALKQKQ